MTGLSGNIGMSSYEELQNTASTLDKSIDTYAENVESLFKIVEDMRSYWQGNAGEASLQKVESYKPQFMDLATTLSGYPTSIRTAVSAHQNAENEAISRAGRA